MSGIRATALCLGLSTLLTTAAPSSATAETVALELVLATDVSSSVDETEFRLQIDALAAAFADPSLIGVLEAHGSDGVAVTLVQWAGVEQQAIALDWTRIDSELSALELAARIAETPRLLGSGATAIGEAINFASEMLWNNAYQGRRLVIDVSGDGIANEGMSPALARAQATRAGITINALAIVNEEPDLPSYYRAGVVGGPGAFMMVASDYEDFAHAMLLKLIAEISGPAIAERPAPWRSAAHGAKAARQLERRQDEEEQKPR